MKENWTTFSHELRLGELVTRLKCQRLLVARNVLVLNPVVVYQDISENLLS